MTAKHTPTFKLEYHTNQKDHDAPFHYELVEQGDDDGSIVYGEVYTEEHAALIVKAVNSHQALIDALETLLHSETVDRRDYEQAETTLKTAKGE